ncbi:hypothetical protein BCEP4_1140076 [Burkholderia cepacia]|nr:hypothetical protein BCEP4_1140076 [Burkholderia cepacia]
MSETLLLSWADPSTCSLFSVPLAFPLFCSRYRDTKCIGIRSLCYLSLQLIDLLTQSGCRIAACKMYDSPKHCAVEGWVSN